jgi:hypothetical protein
MQELLNAHAAAMRKLLKAASTDKPVSVEALKLVETHARTARLLQEAAADYLPYKDAEGPPAPKKVPRSINAMREANERISWCQARDAAEAGLKRAVKRSEKLLKKPGEKKAPVKS